MGSGCMVTRVTYDPASHFRDLGAHYTGYKTDPKNVAAYRAARKKGAKQGYAVLLKRFSGKQHRANAKTTLNNLKRVYNISELWLDQSKEEETILYRGHFRSGTAFKASISRDQVLKIHAFGDAEIVYLGNPNSRKRGEYDIGRTNGKYALQVGIFTDQISGFREAAELYVKKLRGEGHEAYYSHSRYSSTILIGSFSYREAFQRQVGTTDRYADEIVALQAKFPANIVNGHELLETYKGEKQRVQPSCLVEVNRY